MYGFLIGNQLRKMYIAGPVQLGFWGGASTTEICQQLSPLSFGFWDHNLVECAKMVDRKFEAFETTVLMFFYFVSLYQLVQFTMRIVASRCQRKERLVVVPLIQD